MRRGFVNVGGLTENGIAETEIGDLGAARRNASIGFRHSSLGVDHRHAVDRRGIINEIPAWRAGGVRTGISGAGNAVQRVIGEARRVADCINLFN